jgi:hypothetical protein
MSTTAYSPNRESGTDAAIAVRRFVNDEIARVAADFDRIDGSVFDFLCECGDLACRQDVQMTLAEYRFSRAGSVVRH